MEVNEYTLNLLEELESKRKECLMNTGKEPIKLLAPAIKHLFCGIEVVFCNVEKVEYITE
jgi:hypothetical protein